MALKHVVAAVSFVVAVPLGLTLGVGAQAPTPLRTRLLASGFSSPLAVVQDPTDPFVQFVVEQSGRIRPVRAGEIQPDLLNLSSAILSGGERGLLGMAFAPDYATSGRFFVDFTNQAGDTVVARFRRSSNPLVADASSRFDLKWGPEARGSIAQPFSNHNGGNLVFGPDGYLYIGLGDGGSSNDPSNYAQTRSELLGKMLRIDVNVAELHPAGYVVPPGNPFVGIAGTRPEIWSFGLRNPWRYSFDDVARGGTGALVIADVGQGRYEEIDYEPRGRGGRNYGWACREGAHDNVTTRPPAFLPLTEPIHEYDHSIGSSITGGLVYRGNALGTFYRGRYFFGDFVTSRVWSVALTVNQATGEAVASDRIEHTADLGGAAALGGISSFGVDANGELFIVSYAGAVYQIISSTTKVPPTPTGLRIIR